MYANRFWLGLKNCIRGDGGRFGIEFIRSNESLHYADEVKNNRRYANMDESYIG